MGKSITDSTILLSNYLDVFIIYFKIYELFR